jgi:hypothetical protein
MTQENEVNIPAASGEGVETVPSAPVEIDYEAELKSALAREAIANSDKENYRKALLIDKGKIVNDGTVDVNAVKEQAAQEDKVDIQEVIRRTVLETASTLVQKPTLDAMLRELSSNPLERDLIKYHYEHSLVKSGLDESSVRADIEKAYAIANGKKLRKTVSEMKVALDNRSQISNMPGGGSQDTIKEEIKNSPWSPEDLAEMKKRGVNPDKVWQNYQKNLSKNK